MRDAHINLLPRGDVVSTKRQKIVRYIQATFILLLLGIGVASLGLWTGSKLVLTKLGETDTEVSSLEKSVSSYSSSEQQYHFLAERLGKVAGILDKRRLLADNFSKLSSALPAHVSVVSVKLAADSPALDMALSASTFSDFDALLSVLESQTFSRLTLSKISRGADGMYFVGAIGELR